MPLTRVDPEYCRAKEAECRLSAADETLTAQRRGEFAQMANTWAGLAGESDAPAPVWVQQAQQYAQSKKKAD